MTGIDIFTSATYWAGVRRDWLKNAAAPAHGLTRRQCLHRARKAEALIVNYSIKAECQASRELAQKGVA